LIRDRFALAILGVTVGFFSTLAALAWREDVPRNIDIVVLSLAALLQLGLLVTWIFIRRLPRWIAAGWGLILVALGIGVVIAAPIPAGATSVPWALVGLVVGGIVTIVLSAVHSSGRSVAVTR
jgi:hypothetical protein